MASRDTALYALIGFLVWLSGAVLFRLSGALLKAVFPERADDGDDPKFPTRYDWCRGSERRMVPMLHGLGFREAKVLPFWGHGYFQRLPGLREADAAFNRLAARRNWRDVTTYAYVLARK